MKQLSVDFLLGGIRLLIPQALFHPITDTREKPWACENTFLLGHHACLPDLRQIGKPGVAGDLFIHAGKIIQSPDPGKPDVSRTHPPATPALDF